MGVILCRARWCCTRRGPNAMPASTSQKLAQFNLMWYRRQRPSGEAQPRKISRYRGRMTSVPLSAPPPPAIATSPIAGFWRRITALAVDLLILGVPTLLLGLALFRWAVGLGQAGRLVGFVVA